MANQAFKQARGIILAGRNSSIATGNKFNSPQTLPLMCQGILEVNQSSGFDYWVKVANGPRLPAQTHRALKNALRKGGKLRPGCEVRQGKRGGLFVRCFVEFEKKETVTSNDFLGVDVGVNAGVARSDGYIGKSLRPLLNRSREKKAEQRRQGHLTSSLRTASKQFLDQEAHRIVNVCLAGGKTLVIERLSTLGNLKMTGRIGQWARVHLGTRCSQLAELAGVSRAYIHQIENGECPRPSAQVLFGIAAALGTSIAHLLGRAATGPEPEAMVIPDGLRQFAAEQPDLRPEDVEMLARIRFRGRQPKTAQDWAYLWESIRRTVER